MTRKINDHNPLSEKAVLASVKVRCWTGRLLDRRVSDEINTRYDADPDAIRANKLLISQKYFRPVYAVVNNIRVKFALMTQPWLDEGTRILATMMYDHFSETFGRLEQDYNLVTDEFARNFPRYKFEARKRLKSMYVEEEFPHPDTVREKFKFHMHIRPFPDINDFRISIAKEHMEDIRANLQEQLKEAMDTAMQEPFRRITAVVGHMAERLKAYQPGDLDKKLRAKNTFRDSLVENIEELVNILPAFNLTDNKALNNLIERIQDELCREDARVLRENTNVRTKVAKAAEDILKQAEMLMG